MCENIEKVSTHGNIEKVSMWVNNCKFAKDSLICATFFKGKVQ